MDEAYYADRALLRQRMRERPGESIREHMTVTGRSRSWVKKWRKRLREASAEDESVLRGQSRAPRRRAGIASAVEERILAIRDAPPDGLQRTPGPKTILYYLEQDTALRARYMVPRAQSTIWRVLRRHGRIVQRVGPPHVPLVRPVPLSHWQLDFKDISSVPADRAGDGKRQHVLEALNLVDVGTSLLLDYRLHSNFTTETAIEAVVACLSAQGVPEAVTFDRDPRFVGSWSGQDFPAAWVRLWHALGVRVEVCPPQRPDRNAFVERYHRAYQEECLAIHRPADAEHAERVTAHFAHHYNFQRPNQALSCANRPPRSAFPTLPRRPPLPTHVDPNSWLKAVQGRVFVRRVTYNGTIRLNNHAYYVKADLKGQFVTAHIDASTRQLVIEHRQRLLKRIPLHGLHPDPMPLTDYVALLCREAHQEWRRHLRSTQRRVTMS